MSRPYHEEPLFDCFCLLIFLHLLLFLLIVLHTIDHVIRLPARGLHYIEFESFLEEEEENEEEEEEEEEEGPNQPVRNTRTIMHYYITVYNTVAETVFPLPPDQNHISDVAKWKYIREPHSLWTCMSSTGKIFAFFIKFGFHTHDIFLYNLRQLGTD